MTIRDIIIGVDVDSQGVRNQVDLLDNLFETMGESLQMTLELFNEYEERSESLGTTTEVLAGISSDTANSLRDLNKELANLKQVGGAAALTFLGQFSGELKEVSLAAETFFTTVKEGFERGGIGGGIAGFFAGQAGAAGQFLGLTGRAGRDVSDSELQRRATLRANIEARVEEEIAEKREALDAQTQAKREQAQQRLLASQAQAAANQAVFLQSQDIDREAFLRQQQVDLLTGGPNLEALQRQQRIDLAKFDIRQQAQVEKRDVAAQARAQAATVQTESNTAKIAQSMDQQLVKLDELRQALLTERLESSGLRPVEDVD